MGNGEYVPFGDFSALADQFLVVGIRNQEIVWALSKQKPLFGRFGDSLTI